MGSVEDGAEILVDYHLYKVYSLYGQGGRYRHLGVREEYDMCDYAIKYRDDDFYRDYRFFDLAVGEHFHFEDDPGNKIVHTANSEDILFFANHLKKILKNFLKEKQVTFDLKKLYISLEKNIQK